MLRPGVTTIEVSVHMGSVGLIVPPHIGVDVNVGTFMGSVENGEPLAPLLEDSSRPIIRVTGAVRMGSCEVVTSAAKRDARGLLAARERSAHARQSTTQALARGSCRA